MDDAPRLLRFGTATRGTFIAVAIAAYLWFFQQPQGSYTQALLVSVALQVGVLLLRRLVPPVHMPQMMDIVELIADGITVLMFAIGVYGGLARMPMDI
jgi:hypothetical protein